MNTICDDCPLLETIIHDRRVEKIRIEGIRDDGERWYVDIVTDDKAGHGHAGSFMGALHRALHDAAKESQSECET